MAKVFYNAISGTYDVESVGTAVNEPGQTLQERKQLSQSKNFYVLDIMHEQYIDIAQATRAQLSKQAVQEAELVISMDSKENTPEWLLNSPKYVFWDVPDPRGQGLEHTRENRDDIKVRIFDLLNK